MPPPANSQPEQIFLSYSRNDCEAAVNLRDQLVRQGLSVFKDDDSIREGDLWLDRLQGAVNACGAFVVQIGRDGVGRWIGAETQVALSRHFGPQRLPIFPILLGETQADTLPAFLRLFQATPWNGIDPLPARLFDSIRERAIVAGAAAPIEGCPFVGLAAYSTKQAHLFFGRQKETLDALACFDTRQGFPPVRWLEINGNCGCGKSSLMRAGLLPLVDQGWLWPRTGYAQWRRIGPLMPGAHPMEMLAEHLARAFEEEMADVRKHLEVDDDRALAHWLRSRKKDDTAFLLAVDQFEELFTFANPDERRRFERLLAKALADPDCPLFVISTVRAYSLDRFEYLPQLVDVQNRVGRKWTLPPISVEGLYEIIDGPARLAGLDVSGVRETMVTKARDEPGALPLVENALHWLWQQRTNNCLSRQLLDDQGGLAGILSRGADDLLESLGKPGRDRALELLFRLVKVDLDGSRHARQRIPLDDAVAVAGGGETGRAIVDRLAGTRASDGGKNTGPLRLITVTEEAAGGDTTGRWVNLIHETLIRSKRLDATSKPQPYWPTLWTYIEQHKKRAARRERLQLLAREWKDHQGFARLFGLAGWSSLFGFRGFATPGSIEQRFLTWSRRKASGLTLLLLLVIGFLGESFYWTIVNDLPLDSMLTRQRFRLGYAPLPEFVAIPAGSFDMGEQDKTFVERIPQNLRQYFGVPGRVVEIAEGFNLSQYEVTYEQFDYYVWEQHRQGYNDIKYPTTAKGGRGMRPVVNVSWIEATAYTKWLGERLHRNCRLLTEAEWEYAARAETYTAYPWGDYVGQNKANCNDCGSHWDNHQSAPVGSFPANVWGLHDTSGNVWEWTCSEWREQFDGSEQLCADQSSKEKDRVIRGGGWSSKPDMLRLAARRNLQLDDIDALLGFRVLCSSPID
ncbi:MAG: SUMF1/EgtB/PvdO family nonheme iron enzyme [Candidatus Contendobacter sp.]|nr:SUMF1/EgtB/PvdO family nonheme iron enzyme [Candidatus Contendobacter sp.]